VDIRVKAFAQEAAERLGFLHTEFGFTHPEAVPDDLGAYPLLLRLRFNRPDVAVEISLVLSYGGEDYVASDFVVAGESGSTRRTHIGRNTAHTGFQMRRALDLQAAVLRLALTERPAAGRPSLRRC
jgi:hypothetical protein